MMFGISNTKFGFAWHWIGVNISGTAHGKVWYCFHLKGALIYRKLLFCCKFTQRWCADVCPMLDFLKNAAKVVNLVFARQILFVVKQHIMCFTCPRFAVNLNVSHLPVTAPPLLFPVCRDCKKKRKRKERDPYESVSMLNLTCTFFSERNTCYFQQRA